MRKILFLSALDFKEKSIQVIKKTPEAYAKDGWNVNYIVARDTSPKGNYFYERTIDLPGVIVDRFNWPLPKLRSTDNRFFSLVFNKISSFIVILTLFFKGFLYLLKNRDCEYIYGYEMQGVLASNILKIFLFNRRCKLSYISRFQGVFYIKEHVLKRKYVNLLFNFDVLLALWLPSDLLVMTNDGTQGDVLLRKIKSRSLSKLRFLSNGVDIEPVSICESQQMLLNKYSFDSRMDFFVMVSRLVSIKRIHLCIEAVEFYLKRNNCFRYKVIVVGDGPELDSLKELVLNKNLDSYFYFVGAVPNIDVYSFIKLSKGVISLYESSNIGNPFFESMICGVPFIAVNNGDTGKFVQHEVNGYLLREESIVVDLVAFFESLNRESVNLCLLSLGAEKYAADNVMSWNERMKLEIEQVINLK